MTGYDAMIRSIGFGSRHYALCARISPGDPRAEGGGKELIRHAHCSPWMLYNMLRSPWDRYIHFTVNLGCLRRMRQSYPAPEWWQIHAEMVTVGHRLSIPLELHLFRCSPAVGNVAKSRMGNDDIRIAISLA